jgi:RecA-family ATPase
VEALRVNVPRAERVIDLLARDFPDNPSYIDPMILTKGGTLLLGGEAKVGKSFIMLELCRALTTGTPFMDNPSLTVPEPLRTLYIDAEVGERTNKARVIKNF